MKVGITGFVLSQGKSGIATYVLNLIQALDRLNANVLYDVLTTQSGCGLLPPLSHHFVTQSSASFVENPICNILWHNSVLPLIAKVRSYDLVHIPSIRRIPMVKSCPVVATVHDMAPYVIPDKYDSVRMFYHKQLLSRLINRCDCIITISQSTKDDIVKYTSYPPDWIHVIHSGIDQALFKPLDPLSSREYLSSKYGLVTPYIVYVSRIEHPGKNHLRLIQAFELFKRHNQSNHTLLLAGADWPGAKTVKEYAHHSAFSKDIRFLGFVSPDDIVNLYCGSDLAIVPSLYEGFGFPLLEAMACKAAVTCSNVGSLRELAGFHARMFNPLDIEDISHTMTASVSSPPDKLALEQAYAYACSFTWERTAQQVLNIYKKVAS